MRKITSLLSLLLIATTVMFGQTTHMVTSNADSGEGTLRQLIADAASGDSIAISEDITEIILASEISAGKTLKINGQGATVKVAEPGVSTYRVFNFSFAGVADENEVSLYNITLIGGNVVANTLNNDDKKGGVLFIKRSHLKMINCSINSGEAYNGGGIANGESSLSLYMKDCSFSGNVGTNGHCAASLSFAQGMQIINCVFEDNGSKDIGLSASGVDITQPGVFTKCIFRNNKTNGTRGGAALSVRNGSGTVSVENCLFEGNINNGNDGGPAITRQKNGSIVVTNSTFYDNVGGRGAFYVYEGKAVVLNSTFAANKCLNTSGNYGGAFYARSDGATIVTLVNNIFAYNYKADGALKDVFCASGGNTTLDGTNNLIANGQNIASLPGRISFAYDSADPENDTPLFASYTTNADGKKIPVLDAETGTIPLFSKTSVAIDAGINSFTDVTIPTLDQRGQNRNATTPCIGSYEYIDGPTVKVEETGLTKFNCWSAEGNLNIVSESIQTVNLFSAEGRLVERIQLHEGLNTIYGLAKGFYLLNNQKVVIK